MQENTSSLNSDDAPGDAMVIATTVYSLPEAATTKALLHAYGIPCVVIGQMMAANHWHMIRAMGGMAVYVPRLMKDRANLLLAQVENSSGYDDSLASIPRLGRFRKIFLVLTLVFLTNLPIVIWDIILVVFIIFYIIYSLVF